VETGFTLFGFPEVHFYGFGLTLIVQCGARRMSISGLLANGWIVGIATSLVAGGLISLFSWLILSKRKRQEFLQRVLIANREVIYAIRPGIAEGHIPTNDVLEGLANATARKYELERKDLFTPSELTDELIKEVMDSSFLSSGQKNDYCAKVTPLRQQAAVAAAAPQAKMPYRDKIDKAVSIVSAVLGVLAAIVSIGLQKGELFGKLEKNMHSTQAQILVSAAVFGVGALLLVIYYSFSQRAKIRGATEKIEEISRKVREATKNLDVKLKG
jgi:hypothetical protein